MGNYKKLSVFDFDNTLFKSPDTPKNFKGNWYASKQSLNEPAVPKKPDDSFWNLDIVNAAKKELSDSQTYCIMLTGRIDQFFQDRIEELLKQKGLNFKLVGLNEFGMDTAEFKVNKIKKILKKYQSIKNIEMWEDEPEKAEIYRKEFKQMLKINIKKNKKLNEMEYFLTDSISKDILKKLASFNIRFPLKELEPLEDLDFKFEFYESVFKIKPPMDTFAAPYPPKNPKVYFVFKIERPFAELIDVEKEKPEMYILPDAWLDLIIKKDIKKEK